MDGQVDNNMVALVTPTYWRDLELCALLCESVDRYLTSFTRHYLIVADADIPMFAKFSGPRRVVLPASHLLPSWLKPLPRVIRRKGRHYWYSLRSKPVSGWHVQQFLKIAAVSRLPEQRYCILDSDVVFFRPFDLSGVAQPSVIPLFHRPNAVEAQAPLHAPWVRSSHRLLGLDAPAFPADDFIDHIIFWDQRSVQALVRRIESVTGREWVEALCRERDVSEYMLYGYFVQTEPDLMRAHELAVTNRCVSYWGADALDEAEVEGMLSAADQGYVAFSAASFSGTPVQLVRSVLDRFAGPQVQVA
jgi:hypothetical protein